MPRSSTVSTSSGLPLIRCRSVCPSSIDHPTGYRLEKLGMRNTIEVTTEVCVNNFLMASIDQLVDPFHGVQRAAVLPISVLFRLQVGLEDRFEDQNCRHFRRPIPDGGYS